MSNSKGQSEFRYSKDSKHLPMFGAGPFYCFTTGAITALSILLDRIDVIPAVRPSWARLLFLTMGIACILSWGILWGIALFKDRLDDKILENRLVTSGAYACVRNPIYTAFTLLFCGALFINGNVLTFILPFLYWRLLTVLLQNTEEKWLKERFGAEYEAYCRKVNRCIPGIPGKDMLYESDISDARWIAYDLPGNAGWILYFVGVILSFAGKPALTESEQLLQMVIAAMIPAMLMLIGIIELISERIRKLDRILPRNRLWRGFGALTLGGLMGTAASVILLICAAINAVGGLLCLWLMLAGGILCSVFAGLLLGRYRKK